MEEEPAPPSLRDLSYILGSEARWKILRELAKGDPLPIVELARRIGSNPASVSKHMLAMRQTGFVQQGFGRLYSLAPPYRPAPGSSEIDFGHCVIRPTGVQP